MADHPTPERFSEWNEEMVARHDPGLFHHHPRKVVRWVEDRHIRTVLMLLQSRPTDRVLEVGCGSGDVLARAPARERHALDLSRRMVRRARETLGDGARVLLADAEQLPYPAVTFDRVICASVLSHVLHPERVLEEAYRVLKPGGRLVVSVSYEAAIERGLRLAQWVGLSRWLLGGTPGTPEVSVYASEYHLHRFDLALLREVGRRLPPARQLKKVPFYPVHWVALYIK